MSSFVGYFWFAVIDAVTPRNTVFDLTVVKNRTCCWNFDAVYHTFRCTYFQFRWPYCCFLLSVVVEITVFHWTSCGCFAL